MTSQNSKASQISAWNVMLKCAKLQQQEYYELLPEYTKYEKWEYKYLKQNIGFALFGPPSEITEENSTVDNSSETDDIIDKMHYKQMFQTIIDKIFNQVCENGEGAVQKECIYFGIIFNITFSTKNDSSQQMVSSSATENEKSKIDFQTTPIFKIKRIVRRIVNNDSTRNKYGTYACEERYIDAWARLYTSWAHYKETNVLHPCIMVIPKNGFYQPDPTCEMTEEHSTVWLEVLESPACSPAATVVNYTDRAANVLGATSVVLSVAAIFTPAAPFVLGAVATGAVSGVWSTGRAVHNLVDRSNHKQSINITEREALGSWLSIAGGVLTAATAGGNVIFMKAIRKGSNINSFMQFAYNSLLVSNLGVNGCGIAYNAYCMYEKYKEGTISAYDILSFGTHVLFFGNAVMNFQFAGDLIESTQGKILDDYRTSLRSKRLRKAFNRAKREAAANTSDRIAQNAEVIRYVNNKTELQLQNNLQSNSNNSSKNNSQGTPKNNSQSSSESNLKNISKNNSENTSQSTSQSNSQSNSQNNSQSNSNNSSNNNSQSTPKNNSQSNSNNSSKNNSQSTPKNNSQSNSNNSSKNNSQSTPKNNSQSNSNNSSNNNSQSTPKNNSQSNSNKNNSQSTPKNNSQSNSNNSSKNNSQSTPKNNSQSNSNNSSKNNSQSTSKNNSQRNSNNSSNNNSQSTPKNNSQSNSNKNNSQSTPKNNSQSNSNNSSKNNSLSTPKNNSQSNWDNSSKNNSQSTSKNNSQSNSNNSSNNNSQSTPKNNSQSNSNKNNSQSTPKNNSQSHSNNSSKNNSQSTPKNNSQSNSDNSSKNNSQSTPKNNSQSGLESNLKNISKNNSESTSQSTPKNNSQSNSNNSSNNNSQSTPKNNSQSNSDNSSKNNSQSTPKNNSQSGLKSNLKNISKNNSESTSQSTPKNNSQSNSNNSSNNNSQSTPKNNSQSNSDNSSKNNWQSTPKNNSQSGLKSNLKSISKNNSENTSQNTSKNNSEVSSDGISFATTFDVSFLNGKITINGIVLLDPIKFAVMLLTSPKQPTENGAESNQCSEAILNIVKNLLRSFWIQMTIKYDNKIVHVPISKFVAICNDMMHMKDASTILQQVFKIAASLTELVGGTEVIDKAVYFVWYYVKESLIRAYYAASTFITSLKIEEKISSTITALSENMSCTLRELSPAFKIYHEATYKNFL